MKKQDILQVLEDNQIQAFEAMEGLDVGCDIILKESSMDEFVRFCKSVESKIAFYELSYFDLDEYIVDEEMIRERIEELVSEKSDEYDFEDKELLVDDFEVEIDQKIQAIRAYNTMVTKAASLLDQTDIMSASVYVIYNGVQVGVELENDIMDSYVMAFEIEDSVDVIVDKLLAPRLSQYEEDAESRYERLHREWEEQKKRDREQREAEMVKIRVYIESDDSLLKCTNQKLRHTYAKQIVDDHRKESDVAITIGDVEAIAEEVYRKKKAK